MNFDELRQAIEVAVRELQTGYDRKHALRRVEQAWSDLNALEREHAERERRLREAHQLIKEGNAYEEWGKVIMGSIKLTEILNSSQ